MQHAQRLTLVEMREFVASSGSLNFIGAERKKIYSLVERTPHTQLRLPPLPPLEHPRKGDPRPAPAYRARGSRSSAWRLNMRDGIHETRY